MLTESAARAIVTDGWANESAGDVEAPTGAFALIIITPAEIATEIWETFDFSPQDVTAGFYLEQTDSQGNTSVTEFEREWEVRAAYTTLEQEYAEWDDQ
jgi:hypothetical protein